MEKIDCFAAAAIDVGVFRSMITSSRALVRRPESRISHARKKKSCAPWKRNNNNENVGFEIHFDANEEKKTDPVICSGTYLDIELIFR